MQFLFAIGEQHAVQRRLQVAGRTQDRDDCHYPRGVLKSLDFAY